jgi:hypothetical protein
MIRKYFRSRLIQVFVASFLIFGSSLAQAQESDADDGWQFAIAPYLWGSDISGQTQGGLPIDVAIGDLLDNLEGVFMAAFEARKNKWLILADYIYLDVAASKQVDPLPLPIDVNLEGTVFHLAGGYNLYQEKSRLDLIFGARNLDLDLGLSTVTTGPVSLSRSGNNLDAIIGVKGQLTFSKRWYLPYYLDVGTGDSDLSWQATAGVSFRAAKWVDLALVYRHLEWEFDSDKLLQDISFSGPAFGAIFRF